MDLLAELNTRGMGIVDPHYLALLLQEILREKYVDSMGPFSGPESEFVQLLVRAFALHDFHQPVVSVASFCTQDRKVLVGKRCGYHGAGYYHFQGGRLEKGEDPEVAVLRELKQEAGIDGAIIRQPQYGHFMVTNNIFREEQRHSLTLWYHCRPIDREQKPSNNEPDRNEGWWWYTLQELEDKLSPAARAAAHNHQYHPELNWVPIRRLKERRQYLDI
jgi:ADP-ribose pyrophosphatase YjhB (NUDIX family)